jgi:orotidine-5'-phosphate decarboxylase
MSLDLPPRSIVLACDVDFERFEHLVRATADIPQLGGYKIGATLALQEGLRRIVDVARQHTNKPLIYDHQKAATDIPDTADAFMRIVEKSGVDAVILFPLAGPVTEVAWIKAASAVELTVIVGAYMTHPSYLNSGGGYIADSAIDRILTVAVDTGVTDFVVPGNNPREVDRTQRLLSAKLGEAATFYSPGFVQQGGDLVEAARLARTRWHAIVGRAIYSAEDVRAAALRLAVAVG